MVEYHNAPRDIFHVTELMYRLSVIKGFEEDKFSDVPGWEGQILSWTDKAVLFHFPKPPHSERPSRENWFPLSTIRKAEDEQSVYVSIWILEKKGL